MLDDRSLEKLQGVHPDLVKAVTRAASISAIPFVVTEGLRSAERQHALLAAGATKTLRSRHLTGHAVDIAAKVDGEIRWDWPLYERLAAVMKAAASSLAVPLEWGGDWASFRDGPHYQLPWEEYP